jgi:sugar (pentulose or hexulose) kinase
LTVAAPVFLGIDIGTSGVRGSCINLEGNELASLQIQLDKPAIENGSVQQDPWLWKDTVFELILQLSKQVGIRRITALAIDGTSGTVLLCDKSGRPVSPALMYNDQSSLAQAESISYLAPPESAAHGASSSLAKAMQLLEQYPEAAHICHQADWVTANLTGRFGISDENNCLKLGYDPVERCWPEWLMEAGIKQKQLPRVKPPGSVIGKLDQQLAFSLGLDLECSIVAGTTDSIAAFIATGASKTGDAVTSLGSTLVLKVISEQPVNAPEYGIYSHRLGQLWLAGGASNSGCRVLSELFSQNEIDNMTAEMKPDEPTGLDYYPLPATGERFPENSPDLEPRLHPRPKDNQTFFQGILEGITRIELTGYQKLAELGAPYPKKIYTTGGGSRNVPWALIRKRELNVPIVRAEHTEASYGSAKLARQGYLEQQ